MHSQGLKFGIHIVRGIPRASVERNLPIANSTFRAQDAADTSDACPWDPTNWGIKNNEAGQAWYDSLLTQYAMTNAQDEAQRIAASPAAQKAFETDNFSFILEEFRDSEITLQGAYEIGGAPLSGMPGPM